MLAPTSDRETSSSREALLGPPPARPPPSLMGFSPPAYSNSAHAIKLPDVPNTELPPLSHLEADNDIKLPSLSSLTSEMALDPPKNHWPPLNPIHSYHPLAPLGPQTMDSPTRMDLDASSNSVVSAPSPDRLLDARSSSVSLDDPDVRLAAEALGDLRAGLCSSCMRYAMRGS